VISSSVPDSGVSYAIDAFSWARVRGMMLSELVKASLSRFESDIGVDDDLGK
jgi:hypothetical protein